MTTFDAISDRLEALAIEVPSWAYGNSGTRFKVFGTPGHPAHRRGEDRRRRDGAPVHRPRADRRAAHPVGPGRRLRQAQGVRRGPRACALGTINSNTFQDDDYKLGSLTHADPEVRAQGGPAQPRLHRGDGRDRLARPQDLARRRHQLPRPGRHARPPGLARRGAADDLRPARRRPAAGAGVQVLRAGVLPHRRPGLGHVVRPRDRPGRQGDRLPRHRPPRARHQHRVHRRPAAAAREARLVRLQQPLLRRRRPDRRGGRPVPAVPDHGRGGPRRRLRRPGQPTSR